MKELQEELELQKCLFSFNIYGIILLYDTGKHFVVFSYVKSKNAEGESDVMYNDSERSYGHLKRANIILAQHGYVKL